jgi:hypothetical protein
LKDVSEETFWSMLGSTATLLRCRTEKFVAIACVDKIHILRLVVEPLKVLARSRQLDSSSSTSMTAAKRTSNFSLASLS